MANPLSRAALLETPLGELAGYWLEIRCGRCGSAVFYPCKLMAQERGAALCVSKVLTRLRCRQCGDKPARVLVTDDPTGGVPDSAATWKVELVP